ncbi:MAG TPA: hypothetical protein EYP04_00315 [Anaerolineae bacterium]|nr:hypothetical protein [Anaerolineae bacterium]
MTYDLHAFRPTPGRDPIPVARRLLAEQEQGADINPGPLDPAAERVKKRLADALRRAVPELQVFSFDFSLIAQAQGISIDEAKRRYRHLELNAPDDGSGIQIILYDDRAELHVPYWHGGEEAEEVFREVWTCLGTLQEERRYAIYDPQLDRILDLDADFDDVVARYEDVVGMI